MFKIEIHFVRSKNTAVWRKHKAMKQDATNIRCIVDMGLTSY